MSLVTLGVGDLGRARAFYEALGWTTGAEPDDDVVFFQTGGSILALWDRGKLADDSAVPDPGGRLAAKGNPDGGHFQAQHLLQNIAHAQPTIA